MDDRLKELLPSGEMYKYTVESITNYQPLDKSSFTALFTINISTSAEFEEWKTKFESRTNTFFNFSRSTSCEGKFVSLKKTLKCHHNVQRGRLAVNKHTACPAEITVTMRSLPKRIRKGRTKVRPDTLCLIKMCWTHNHPFNTPDVLRHHKVSVKADSLLIHLFSNGHSLNSALSCLKLDLGDNLSAADVMGEVAAKRFICPDYHHCHYVFCKIFGKRNRDIPYLDNFDELIDRWNRELGEHCVEREDFGNGNKQIIAICTPFMRRVHQHCEESGEIVYLDSSRGLVRNGCRIFLLMTRCRVGALPLAVGIVPAASADNVDCLTRLFNLVKRVLHEDESFAGRGINRGPTHFMTDGSMAQKTALHNVWPLSRTYQSQYHILQAQWRWLLLPLHEIKQEHRIGLYELFKSLVFAPTESDLFICLKHFLESELVRRYPLFEAHVRSLYNERKEAWCSAFRPPTVRENHANNYLEGSMIVLKNQILHRIQTFNVTQFVHFIVKRFSVHFQRRLLDFVNNRKIHASTEKYPPYSGERIKKMTENIYSVLSSNQDGLVHTVNMNIALCSCPEGSGAVEVCKHMHYVLTESDYFAEGSFDDCSALFYTVATGDSTPCEWLDAVHGDYVYPGPSHSLQELGEPDAGIDLFDSKIDQSYLDTINCDLYLKHEPSLDNEGESICDNDITGDYEHMRNSDNDNEITDNDNEHITDNDNEHIGTNGHISDYDNGHSDNDNGHISDDDNGHISDNDNRHIGDNDNRHIGDNDGHIGDNVDCSDIEQQIAEWNELVTLKVHSLARNNPRKFGEEYKASIRTLQSMSTIDEAVSALHTFGKYSTENSRPAKRRKLAASSNNKQRLPKKSVSKASR